jgi:multisubunit Na+/H+ antiporter MnhE subunit
MTPRAVLYFFRFLAILVREVIRSSITVAKLALGPLDRLRSGFVSLHMDAQSDIEVTCFANSITLTPGTITVHVDPAHDLLVMHAIDMGDDPEALRRGTKEALEDNILLWTRPGAAPKGD